MMDIVLEVSRTGILLLLVIYLWRAGSKHAELSCKGWRLILAGSCLLLFGSAVDITDNFESLNRFQVIGETPLQAFLEKIIGSLLGFLLLTLGLLRWIPMITSVEMRRALVEELAGTNRRLQERTDELEAEIAHCNRIKETLQHSEEQYRAIFESTTNSLLVTDLKGTVVEANPAACRTYGYTHDELVGLTGRDIVHPDHYGQFEDFMRQLRTSDHFYTESVDLRKDGATFDVEVRGTTFHFRGKPHLLAIVQDVTQRKQVEEALRESRERFALAMQGANDGLWDWNIKTGKVYYSPRWKSMLGCEPEQIADTLDEWKSRLHPEDLHRATKRIGDYWAGRARTFDVEFRMRHLDRHYVDILSRGFVLRDAQGRPARMIGTHVDISERKAAEEALDKLNRELEKRVEQRTAQLQNLVAELELKNTELERFAYTVSHDLKSPLITIKGYLGLLQQDLAEGNSKTAEEDMTRISNVADKMHLLLRQVLDLSRIGRVVHPTEDVGLDTLAHEAVLLLDGTLAKKPADIRIADDLPVLHGDGPRLLEVLQNLIENALKYMGDQSAPCIEIGSRSQGDEVVCYIRDNGLGIDPAYHTKVFGLFDQLDQKVEGSGVGLAIVKRIIEIHGGRIWVESEGLGEGATFCFTIPSRKAVATKA